MPVLSRTPDMSAETWLGAAAWAPGSQKWSGTSPALSPKPSRARAKIQPAIAAPPVEPRHGRELERPGHPAEEREEREEREVPGVGGGQVDERGALRLGLLVLGEDEQEARRAPSPPTRRGRGWRWRATQTSAIAPVTRPK